MRWRNWRTTMASSAEEAVQAAKKQAALPTVSTILDDDSIVEMVYRREQRETVFAVWREDDWKLQPNILIDKSRRLVPYSPHNNLVANGIVVFASEPTEYRSEHDLVGEIQAFIHRYVDVSPLYEKIAAYYVLFSWVYDAFNELPYLRLRGDFGSGKTRFLLTVGSLCYKPIFASGASTVSPIFRLLDTFRGTLIIDEADFRMSDERAEIVKVLNNGNAQGFPVLRSEVNGKGEFNPHAYRVFGPKLVATRGFFEDRALESRCLTEEMGQRPLRSDIPISLPAVHRSEALHLRNKLLLFRFRNLSRCRTSEGLIDRSIEPRLNQVFMPLLSVVDDDAVRKELRELARQYHREQIIDRGMDVEAQVLEVINELLLASDDSRLSIKEITEQFAERYGEEYERKITNKWIGWTIRKKLGLKPQKSQGTFVIPIEEMPALRRLFEKFGVRSGEYMADEGDSGVA